MGGGAGTRLSAGWPRDTDCVMAMGLPLALALGQLWEGVYCCHNNSWQLPTEPAPCWAAGVGTGTPVGRACSGEGGEVALGRLAGPWGALGVLGLGAVLAGARICMGGKGGLLHLLVQTQGVWLVSALERGFPRDT